MHSPKLQAEEAAATRSCCWLAGSAFRYSSFLDSDFEKKNFFCRLANQNQNRPLYIYYLVKSSIYLYMQCRTQYCKFIVQYTSKLFKFTARYKYQAFTWLYQKLEQKQILRWEKIFLRIGMMRVIFFRNRLKTTVSYVCESALLQGQKIALYFCNNFGCGSSLQYIATTSLITFYSGLSIASYTCNKYLFCKFF